MLKTKQIVVIVSVIALMAILLSLNIKGLVKPKDGRSVDANKATEASQVSVVTVESVSATAKQELNASLLSDISILEDSLKSASETEKTILLKKLAQKWDDVNQPAPAAFRYESIAQRENVFSNWLKTGDRFTTAYENTQDSLVQPELVQKAFQAYQNALKLDSSSLEAKTGLGVAYVNGAGSPMQGISLLLAVVKQDPNNIKANMSLGLFSIKSGQFDKAVSRFKTVVAIKPLPEAWFYLASCYENQGMKDEAITAYIKSKELAADPNLGKFVDSKILELRK
ncbi:MAG: tetratricopeptide repeat protein [Daejeonella sp.]|nr:tetratricopeptide repeat protein [Daejeonella sp.]